MSETHNQQFIIEGGHRLSGTVTASGSKNAALKMLPACLLTAEPVILENVPNIRDLQMVIGLLQSLGVRVEWLDATTLEVQAAELNKHQPDPKLAAQVRSSIVMAGPMLARLGQLDLAPPGGDVIGRRRLDTHLLALSALGAEIDFADGLFKMRAPNGLKGANILLDEASVTATENAIMAAVLAEGQTLIRNAASEPHVQNLCQMLNSMGAKIEGLGSNQLSIRGVKELGGTRARVGADYLEVGSFIALAAVTDSAIRIEQADPQHLDMIALVFRKLGVEWQTEGQAISIERGQDLRIMPDFGSAIPEIKSQIWPAFPTDMMSVALVVATQARGAVLFHDWMFDSRLFFTDRLVSMGARIVLCDPHRALVQGPTPLRGDQVISSPDIRAGMALLIAALAADGKTMIRNIHQIDRGYAAVDEKLRGLGAKIQREDIRA